MDTSHTERGVKDGVHTHVSGVAIRAKIRDKWNRYRDSLQHGLLYLVLCFLNFFVMCGCVYVWVL
jgi:hypothetical protein